MCFAEVLVEDVLLPPDVLDMLGGARSKENSLAESSQDLRDNSENVDETEVSSGILLEKAHENIEDSQMNITSCRNKVGTISTKDARGDGRKVDSADQDSTSKLFARWQGPATIIEERNPLHSSENASTKHIHQNKLRHYVARLNAVNVIFEEDGEFGQVETPPTAT
ncbi:uncharacterized protein TNCT_385021 [Trichonephila clavata]|uniref:Uncharacterized protein n=1 Tax=Trichonephila clavata TaxID=2740835 RepID=A0A8X6I6Z2_TRICU|nr:uncharacterized protein TNCT_385021 [Trichonephila clavata]